MIFAPLPYSLFTFFSGAFVVIVKNLTRNSRLAVLALFMVSYLFYYFADGLHLFILLFTSLASFFLAKKISEQNDIWQRRWFLVMGILINLVPLFYFKYTNFLINNITWFINKLGLQATLATLEIALPIGISFYTFQIVSYLVDVYRGKIEVVSNLTRFLAFVSFFPQLIAGPIVRASELLPQLEEGLKFRWQAIRSGTTIIITGLFKKYVVADSIAAMIEPIFEQPGGHTNVTIYVALIGFAVQIYCDFSGYTDMAIGTGKLFGLKLPDNFSYPYFAKNITDFWRRWHMTLTRWVYDYLFMPLFFFFKTLKLAGRKLNFIVPILITMLILGLWHGASMNFLLFGLWNGLVMISYFAVKKYWDRLPIILQVALNFLTVLIGLLIFRAGSINKIIVLFNRVFSPVWEGLNWELDPRVAWLPLLILAFFVTHYLFYRQGWKEKLENFKLSHWLLYNAIVASLVLTLTVPDGDPFIYFQF